MTLLLPALRAPAPVPCLWPGSTVVCLGTGPSLTAADVAYVQGKARVIAINDAYTLAPWADVLYGCDAKWWTWHKGVPSFRGLKYGLQPGAKHWPGVTLVAKTGGSGIEWRRTGIRTGNNSGYQAINLAIHLGAVRILLLGYDMQGQHFFGRHRDGSVPPFLVCLKNFTTMVPELAAHGIEVVNCTRKTALTCFPRLPLAEALP